MGLPGRLRGFGRCCAALLAWLLGLVALPAIGPELPSTDDQVVAPIPAANDELPAQRLVVLIAHPPQGPPAVLEAAASSFSQLPAGALRAPGLVVVVVATSDYDGIRVQIRGYVGTSDPVNRWDPSGLDWVWNNQSREWDYVPGTPRETPKPTWKPWELPILYVDAAIYREVHRRTTRYSFQSGPFTPSPLTTTVPGLNLTVIGPDGEPTGETWQTLGFERDPAHSAWVHLMGEYPAGDFYQGRGAEIWAQRYLHNERNVAQFRAEDRARRIHRQRVAQAQHEYEQRKMLAYTGAAAVILLDIATIPSGEGAVGSAAIWAWARSKLVHAAIGSGIGATDAYLHDRDIWDGAGHGALFGMVFGSGGRLATYGGRPGVSLFYGGAATLGGFGAYESFSEGNLPGGVFRTALTGLAAYPAVRPGHFLRGVANDRDPVYFTLSLRQRALYEIGQRTEKSPDLVPRVTQTHPVRAAVERGRLLIERDGLRGALFGGSRTLGLAEGTISTGPTPAVRGLLPVTSGGAAQPELTDWLRAHAYHVLGLDSE